MITGVRAYLGDRFVISGDSVTKPSGFLDGAILSSLESRRNYILSGNNWLEMNPLGFRIRYDIGSSSIAAQTLIGISGGFSHNTGSNELQVLYNGILLTKDTTPSSRDFDYHHSGSISSGIRMNWAIPPSGHLTFIGFR